jgi:hypothetical protein
MKHEICIICDGATGRAGKGDDSLYCPMCKTGPYCDACYYDHVIDYQQAVINLMHKELRQMKMYLEDTIRFNNPYSLESTQNFLDKVNAAIAKAEGK